MGTSVFSNRVILEFYKIWRWLLEVQEEAVNGPRPARFVLSPKERGTEGQNG